MTEVNIPPGTGIPLANLTTGLLPTPTMNAIRGEWGAAVVAKADREGMAVPALLDTTESLVGAGPWVIGVLDGVLWGATDDYKLWSSTDSGDTWTLRNTVTGANSKIRRLLPVDDGEILVHCLGQVMRSSGWADPDTATWAQVLVPLHAGTYFAEWSLDAVGSIAIATEYGSYADHPWACWVSTDAGATWTQRLDLGAIYTVPEQAELHFHGCAVDPFRGLVWAVNGDSGNVCRLRWSDDNGLSWNDVTDPLSLARITTILPMPDGIILGADAGGISTPNGTYRLRPDLSLSEVSHLIDVGASGLTHVANGTHRDPVSGIGWTTFQGWNGQGYPGIVVASANGRVSHEVWRDPTPNPTNDNERRCMWAFGPDTNGVLHIRLDSGIHNGWHVRGTYTPAGVPAAPETVLQGSTVDGTSLAASPSSEAGILSTALGSGARAGTGAGASSGSTAIGANSSAGNQTDSGNSTAIGRDAATTGFGSTAIGAGAEANSGVAVGNESAATGAGGTALGNQATAAGDLGTAVGTSSSAPYFGDTVMGYGATATSAESAAFGQGATAYWKSTAVGKGAIADTERSVALGHDTNTTANDQVQVGPRHFEMSEVTEPGAPAANNARVFTRDNGSGKTQLCVRFPTGATIVIATEP